MAEIGLNHELASQELTATVKRAACDAVIFLSNRAQHPEPDPRPSRRFLAPQTAIDNHQQETADVNGGMRASHRRFGVL